MLRSIGRFSFLLVRDVGDFALFTVCSVGAVPRTRADRTQFMIAQLASDEWLRRWPAVGYCA